MKRSVRVAIARTIVALALGASATACSAATASSRTLALKIAHADVPLPGSADRFDYESIDPKRRLLAIAHLGSGLVTIVNLRNDRVVANISGLPGVHGVLAVPDLGEIFATATDENTVAVISERNDRVIARAPAGSYPDGMAYDPREHELFISDETGATETVIDTQTNRRIATIPLGGEVGNSQYDARSRLVDVDVQTRDEIAAIDPRTNRVVHRYPLPAICQNDHGLLLDVPTRLGFIACDGNAKLLLVDLPSMHVRSVYDTGDGPDVLAFDTALNRLYVASESGVIATFVLRGQTLLPVDREQLAFDAHVVAVDPATHDVFFPLENVGGRGVLRIMVPEVRDHSR